MNRRGFLKFLGDGAAVATVAAVAPSQVWPFTKIFLPPAPAIVRPTIEELAARHLAAVEAYLRKGGMSWAAVQAIELEAIAKTIPDLIPGKTPLYRFLKSRERIDILDVVNWGRPKFRVPVRMQPGELRMANGSKIIFEPGDQSRDSSESALAFQKVFSAIERAPDVAVDLTGRFDGLLRAALDLKS